MAWMGEPVRLKPAVFLEVRNLGADGESRLLKL